MKVFKSFSIAFVLFFGSMNLAHAAHMIGGFFSISHVSELKYEITFTLFRDGSTRGAPFEQSVGIGIYRSDNGTLFKSAVLAKSEGPIMPSTRRCNQTTLYQSQTYKAQVDFYFDGFEASSYYLNWERCCMNGNVLNLLDPGSQSISFWAEFQVRDSTQGTQIIKQSSAIPMLSKVFAARALNPFSHNFEFRDLDGDELRYSLVNSFANSYASPFSPGQAFGPAPYGTWDYANGLSEKYPIPAIDSFRVDSMTGLITGTPTQMGEFMLAIKVREFRNGKLISSMIMPLVLNVIDSAAHFITEQPKNLTLQPGENGVIRVRYTNPAASYQWRSITSGIDQIILGETRDSLTFSTTDTMLQGYSFYCQIIDSCNIISDTATFKLNLTGIQNSLIKTLQLYPNPTSTNIRFVIRLVDIRIYDFTGALVQWESEGDFINVEKLSPSLYQITGLDEAGQLYGGKFIRQ